MAKNELRDLFRAVLAAVEGLTEEELDLLLARRARLKLVVEPFRLKASGRTDLPLWRDRLNVGRVLDDLLHSGSREEGNSILEAASLTKMDLEQIARHLNLPLLKQDNTERLRDKILEATIGSRLNSEAIRRPQAI